MTSSPGQSGSGSSCKLEAATPEEVLSPRRVASSASKRATAGGFLLSMGGLLSTLVSLVTSVIIVRLLTPDQYGIIYAAFIFPSAFLAFTDFGFASALVRFPAMGADGSAYVGSGLIFESLRGLLASIATYAVAMPLAVLLHRPYLAPLMQILSIYIFANVLSGSIGQILTGLGRYLSSVLITLTVNIFRGVSSVLLVIWGLGVGGAIWGFSIGYTASLAVGLVLLLHYRMKVTFSFVALKEMTAYSLPLFAPSLVGLVLGQYFNVLLGVSIPNAQIGNFSIANNLLTPLTLVGSGLSAALLSSFPVLKEPYKLKDAARKAVLYTSALVAPIALGLVAVSGPLTSLVYGSNYTYAPEYLSLMALQGLLAVLGSYVIGPFLNGIGDTRLSMRMGFVSILVGTPSSLILIRSAGVMGLILAGLLSSMASALYGLHILSAKMSLRFAMRNNIKAIVPSVLSLLASFGLVRAAGNSLFGLAVGIASFLLVLAFTFPVFVRRENISELKLYVQELKVIGRLLSAFLDAELRLSRRLSLAAAR